MRKKITIYLAGAMESAKDLGMQWRNKTTKELEIYDVEVLNPCLFEPEQLKGLHVKRLPEYFTHKKTGEKVKLEHWHQLKMAAEPHLFKRFMKYMRRIIRYDINLLSETSYVICYWDEHTGKGAGTHAELTYAFMQHIPVYCVAPIVMPGWAVGCCTEIFDNFEELYKFLEEELGS